MFKIFTNNNKDELRSIKKVKISLWRSQEDIKEANSKFDLLSQNAEITQLEVEMKQRSDLVQQTAHWISQISSCAKLETLCFLLRNTDLSEETLLEITNSLAKLQNIRTLKLDIGDNPLLKDKEGDDDETEIPQNNYVVKLIQNMPNLTTLELNLMFLSGYTKNIVDIVQAISQHKNITSLSLNLWGIQLSSDQHTQIGNYLKEKTNFIHLNLDLKASNLSQPNLYHYLLDVIPNFTNLISLRIDIRSAGFGAPAIPVLHKIRRLSNLRIYSSV